MILSGVWGIVVVVLLVLANGFFVAAEFSLVAVRRSRVAELVAQQRLNARALERSLGHLDASLAATQLGITLSSLALGWVGEPAISHLIEPFFQGWASDYAGISASVVSITLAFAVITILHIVLGELAPKSLALQRSETTALWVVRPLRLFQWLFHPAISLLNGLGNLVLRLVGLHGDAGEGALHSAQELKLLVSASHKAGLLLPAQRQLVERVLTIGDRRVGDVMTSRHEIEWLDADAPLENMLQVLRSTRHEQLLVRRSGNGEYLGMLLKQDVLNQLLDGQAADPMALLKQPLVIPESSSIFKTLEFFRAQPVRVAVVLDEYGDLEGMVTATDLLAAIAGHLPDSEEDLPEIIPTAAGELLIDGASPIFQMFSYLQLPHPLDNHYHTVAGFVLDQLEHLPHTGEQFEYQGWLFEVITVEGYRIAQVKVTAAGTPAADSES